MISKKVFNIHLFSLRCSRIVSVHLLMEIKAEIRMSRVHGGCTKEKVRAIKYLNAVPSARKKMRHVIKGGGKLYAEHFHLNAKMDLSPIVLLKYWKLSRA